VGPAGHPRARVVPDPDSTAPPPRSTSSARLLCVARTPRPGPRAFLSRPSPPGPPTRRHPSQSRLAPCAAATETLTQGFRRRFRFPAVDAASSSRSSPRDAQGGEGPAGIACLRSRAPRRPRNLAGLRHPCQAAPPRQAPAPSRLHRDHRPRSPRRFAYFA
jgi:hypothetical protein